MNNPLPPGYEAIAAAVAVRRTTPGLTLARVAALSGIEYSYLSRVENGGAARVTPAFAARYVAAVRALSGRTDIELPAAGDAQ